MPADILAAAAADTLGSVSVGGLVGIGQLILPFFRKVSIHLEQLQAVTDKRIHVA